MPSTRTSPIVVDGATGTALLERGLAPGRPPEAWLLERPAEVEAVHAAHVAAGAQLLLTCTFSLASPRLQAVGLAGRARELARAAVRTARAAGAARVAGAVGPVGPAAPVRDPRGAYAAAFEALAAAGADLLWAETQYDLAEARAALAAARAAGLPVVVTLSFTAGEPATLPAGGSVEDALVALAAEGSAAVGVNCVAPSASLERLLARVAPRLGVPLVAKPSPGLPGALLAPEPFGARVAALSRAGAAWVGGCCGATAAHVAAIARAAQPPRG
jgi:5-methyltetrahydrofolate--homocysteine methyltransferase